MWDTLKIHVQNFQGICRRSHRIFGGEKSRVSDKYRFPTIHNLFLDNLIKRKRAMACETVPSGYVTYIILRGWRQQDSETPIIVFQTSQRYVPEKSNCHFPTDISLINSEQVKNAWSKNLSFWLKYFPVLSPFKSHGPLQFHRVNVILITSLFSHSAFRGVAHLQILQ